MALVLGTRLGAYEIRAPIGRGGMGEVYRAWDPRLRRNVAIKVLHGISNIEPDRLRRFEDEARATAALNHTNIVSVYDVGAHNGAPYIVSELLEGQTLRSMLARSPLSTEAAIALTLQLCEGLAAAHDKGIVHRDLKPENLFITHGQHLKILDFGLAKLVEQRATTASTTTTLDKAPGVIIGTVGYLSPEQIKGEVVDCRSDIFTLGIILYEVLAGTRPFRGDNAVETMHAILKQDPPALTSDHDRLGRTLSMVTLRCLEKEPSDRFQTATDISRALGAHVIVTIAPGGQNAVHHETLDVVAYREPPGWLTWSGLTLLALILFVPIAVWVASPSNRPIYPHMTGCLTFNAKDFVFSVGERQYVIDAPSFLDLRPHIGHRVDVSYTSNAIIVSPGARGQEIRKIGIRDIRSIAPACK
jgi:serine/threonine protein kinase